MRLFLILIFSFLIVKECNSISRKLATENHVVKDTSYEMKCSSKWNTKIYYCWFRAPNGTIYSVMPNSTVENNSYSYIGKGFENGECGIRISNASKSDSGIWSCNMGSSNVTDEFEFIQTLVHDTPLISHRRQISFYDEFMQCEILDKHNSSTELEYCRFIRPDGTGLYPQAKSFDYSNDNTSLADGICRLRFLRSSTLNVGKWFCVAKLRSSEIEYYDSVIVENYYNIYFYSSGFAALAWIMFIITMGILTVIVVSAVRRGRVPRDSVRSMEPPPYTLNDDQEIVKVPLP